MTAAECWAKEYRRQKTRFFVELQRDGEWGHFERIRFPALYLAAGWAKRAIIEEEWSGARVWECLGAGVSVPVWESGFSKEG